jgi:hypothetical protein
VLDAIRDFMTRIRSQFMTRARSQRSPEDLDVEPGAPVVVRIVHGGRFQRSLERAARADLLERGREADELEAGRRV